MFSVVCLTKDMFEVRNIKLINKDERVDRTYITIDNRVFSQRSDLTYNPMGRTCTTKGCSCRFRLQPGDAENPYGKAVFGENSKHTA